MRVDVDRGLVEGLSNGQFRNQVLVSNVQPQFCFREDIIVLLHYRLVETVHLFVQNQLDGLQGTADREHPEREVEVEEVLVLVVWEGIFQVLVNFEANFSVVLFLVSQIVEYVVGLYWELVNR